MKGMIDTKLAILHKELLFMGALCEKTIANTARALIDYDLASAELAIQTEIEINKKERDLEAMCIKLLLKQQPVAGDLRKIASSSKIIADMARIGRQARNIAEIILQNHVHIHANNANNENIQAITKASVKIVTDSLDAYANVDLLACKNVIEYDTIVDELFEKIKNDIIHSVAQDKEHIEMSMYILMIAKYFEKIADHATKIAHHVVFSITGK